MTDWYLEVKTFAGVLSYAKHFRGTVKEDFNFYSCHGGRSYNAPESRGKWTCDKGHELPRERTWDVDDFWTKDHYRRYQASNFEIEGPGQFLDEAKLLKVAVARFLGDMPDPEVYGNMGDRWWEEAGYPGEPGDRLIYGNRGYVLEDETLHEEWKEGRMPPDDAYPCVIAVVPPREA